MNDTKDKIIVIMIVSLTGALLGYAIGLILTLIGG